VCWAAFLTRQCIDQMLQHEDMERRYEQSTARDCRLAAPKRECIRWTGRDDVLDQRTEGNGSRKGGSRPNGTAVHFRHSMPDRRKTP